MVTFRFLINLFIFIRIFIHLIFGFSFSASATTTFSSSSRRTYSSRSASTSISHLMNSWSTSFSVTSINLSYWNSSIHLFRTVLNSRSFNNSTFTSFWISLSYNMSFCPINWNFNFLWNINGCYICFNTKFI